MQGLRSVSMIMSIRTLEADNNLKHKDIDNMTDKELMTYVDFLDDLIDKM